MCKLIPQRRLAPFLPLLPSFHLSLPIFLPPQYAVKGRLEEGYAPFIRKPRSSSSGTSGWSSGSSAAASSSSGITSTSTSVRQRWNWVPTQRGAGGAESREVRLESHLCGRAVYITNYFYRSSHHVAVPGCQEGWPHYHNLHHRRNDPL